MGCQERSPIVESCWEVSGRVFESSQPCQSVLHLAGEEAGCHGRSSKELVSSGLALCQALVPN